MYLTEITCKDLLHLPRGVFVIGFTATLAAIIVMLDPLTVRCSKIELPATYK